MFGRLSQIFFNSIRCLICAFSCFLIFQIGFPSYASSASTRESYSLFSTSSLPRRFYSSGFTITPYSSNGTTSYLVNYPDYISFCLPTINVPIDDIPYSEGTYNLYGSLYSFSGSFNVYCAFDNKSNNSSFPRFKLPYVLDHIVVHTYAGDFYSSSASFAAFNIPYSYFIERFPEDDAEYETDNFYFTIEIFLRINSSFTSNLSARYSYLYVEFSNSPGIDYIASYTYADTSFNPDFSLPTDGTTPQPPTDDLTTKIDDLDTAQGDIQDSAAQWVGALTLGDMVNLPSQITGSLAVVSTLMGTITSNSHEYALLFPFSIAIAIIAIAIGVLHRRS